MRLCAPEASIPYRSQKVKGFLRYFLLFFIQKQAMPRTGRNRSRKLFFHAGRRTAGQESFHYLQFIVDLPLKTG